MMISLYSAKKPAGAVNGAGEMEQDVLPLAALLTSFAVNVIDG